MQILIFCLGVIGMSHIIVDSDMPFIVWFRDKADAYLPEKWAKLLHCYVCSGFWCGLLCSWIAFPTISYEQMFLAGCAGSFLSNLAAILLNYLEAQTMLTFPPEDDADCNK